MVKFDLHIHSCYSRNLYGTRLLCPPSKSLPEDIIKTALDKEIKVIAVTDHDNIVGSLRTLETANSKKYKGAIIVIPGVEVSTKDGHILAYNVYENIPRNLSAKETIEIIKKAGGVAVAAHPFNIKYSISTKNAQALQQELFAFEIANSHSLKNKYTKNYVEENDCNFTVGSDAHSLDEIGLCYGKTNEKIKSVKDILNVIENKGVDSFYTNDNKLLRRVIPAAINSFVYWKKQQFKHIFNTDYFLPYMDNNW